MLYIGTTCNIKGNKNRKFILRHNIRSRWSSEIVHVDTVRQSLRRIRYRKMYAHLNDKWAHHFTILMNLDDELFVEHLCSTLALHRYQDLQFFYIRIWTNKMHYFLLIYFN